MRLSAGEESVRVVLRTRWDEFRVPETPLAVPAKLTRLGLSGVVNHMLARDAPQPFDFLVGGKFLRTSLSKFLRQTGASAENVLELEYVPALRQPEPGPDSTLPDWVGAVAGGLESEELFVTGCYDGRVRVLSAAAGETVAAGESGHRGAVKGVDACGALAASGGQDQKARVWRLDAATGALRLAGVCSGHVDSVEAVSFAPSGRALATASWDGSVRLWAVEASEPAAPAGKRRRGAGASAAGAGGEDAGEPEAPCVATLMGHAQPVGGVAWLSEAQLVSGSADHSVKTWDAEAQNCVSTLACSKAVTALAHSVAAGLVATAHPDRSVRVWDVRTDAPATRLCLRSHSEWVADVAWMPGSEHVLASAAHDGAVKLWDVRSTVPLYTVAAHEGAKALGVAWASPTQVVSGGSDSRAVVSGVSV